METKWHENIWNKLLITALIVVVFAWGLNHLDSIYRVVTQVVGILSPFILGGGIAFVLNVPMRRIEQLVRRLTKREWKLNRAIAIVLSLAIVLLIVVFVASIVAVHCGDQRVHQEVYGGIPGMVGLYRDADH